MKNRKILAVCLSLLLFPASGCSIFGGEKAVTSSAGSAEVTSSPPASPASSSSSVSAAAPSAQSPGTGVPQSVGKWIEKAPMSTPRFACGSAVVGGKIYLFGGLTTDYYHGTASAEVYDPGSNRWKKIKSMPMGLHDMQVAVLNGKIYSIGGIRYDEHSYGDAVGTVERYDPAADTWTDLKPMSAIRTGFSLTALNGKLYVIGGESTKNSRILSSVEAYSPDTNTWQEKASLPSPGRRSANEVIDEKIYIIGNYADEVSDSLGPMGIYDPKLNQWTERKTMNVRRTGFDVETVDGKIYVIGGYTPGSNGGSMQGVLTSVEAYDPAADEWTMKAPMIEKKSSFQTAVLNGKIDAIGGWNDIKYGDQAANYLSSVQEYDPQTDKWTEKSPLKIGRKDFITAAVGNSIYAIGGLVGPDRGGAGSALVEEYAATK